MLNFNSKEDKFHKMFSEAASIVKEGAIVLKDSLDDCEKNKQSASEKIEKLEHKAHDLVNDVTKELNHAFITPIDREDIYSIIKGMEGIIGLMNSAMHRFVMFDINKATDHSIHMVDKLVEATSEIVLLMGELKLMGKTNKIKERVISINTIEHDTDHIFRKVVGDLFRNESDPITIIKWKEIYQILENTMDSCERLANNVEGVVMKNV